LAASQFAATDVVRAYKDRSLDLLDLSSGRTVLDLGCG
jgi:cyclopropane fatty-acyl-phospholipid synthase-like methyltransferase